MAIDLALFVYGSLQPGEEYWPRYCEGRVVEQQRARVRGCLYKCRDGYLALAQLEAQNLKLETLLWVRGWRLVLNGEIALQDIDRLEGFDPIRPTESNLYLRERTDCFADDDSPAPALISQTWIYTMTPAQLAHEGAVRVNC